MPIRKLKEYLDQQGVKYVVITHSPAYTSQEVAASAHVSGKEMAKTVVVELDGRKALTVLPANQKIVLHDLLLLQNFFKLRKVNIKNVIDR